MEKVRPISDLQAHSRAIVDEVRQTGEPVVITQRGRPAAMLVNYEEYAGLLATVEEMREPDWRERLAERRRFAKTLEVLRLSPEEAMDSHGRRMAVQGVRIAGQPVASTYDPALDTILNVPLPSPLPRSRTSATSRSTSGRSIPRPTACCAW